MLLTFLTEILTTFSLSRPCLGNHPTGIAGILAGSALMPAGMPTIPVAGIIAAISFGNSLPWAIAENYRQAVSGYCFIAAAQLGGRFLVISISPNTELCRGPWAFAHAPMASRPCRRV